MVELRSPTLVDQGFKSFVEKTLSKLATAYGCGRANGCGKKHVCDAVRWVLGETAPKKHALEEMEDVIFNAAERKQLGMSEVSLTSRPQRRR